VYSRLALPACVGGAAPMDLHEMDALQRCMGLEFYIQVRSILLEESYCDPTWWM
jgi:hypothetical protein